MRKFPPSAALVVPLALALAACTPSAPARGAARPTVEGGGAAAYADLDAAKAAFRRSDGALTAVLEDASWIRLEPDPATASERHPAYLRGYTAFEVSLLTADFVRPTEETYVLTDSTGASVRAKPASWRGGTDGTARKHVATFALEFDHLTSKDVRWLRLTRQGPGGGSVQWDFPGS
jgi:hypothetical protein